VEAVTLTFILIGICILWTTAFVMDERRGRKITAASAEKHRLEAKKEIDQHRVKQLEAEIFGIDQEITGLPGHTWQVTRQNDRISVYLLNAAGAKIGIDSVPFKETTVRYAGGRFQESTRALTVEEIDAAVQKKMKWLSDREIATQKFNAGLKEIVDKYDGKGVVQDA
jgi:hypothetical protein